MVDVGEVNVSSGVKWSSRDNFHSALAFTGPVRSQPKDLSWRRQIRHKRCYFDVERGTLRLALLAGLPLIRGSQTQHLSAEILMRRFVARKHVNARRYGTVKDMSIQSRTIY